MTTKSDTRKDRPETDDEKDARRTRERASFEFGEGERAFREGLPSDANPYPSDAGSSTRRYLFFQGFYDARLVAKGLLKNPLEPLLAAVPG